MSDDITDQAERVLRLRWEQPGPDYPEPVPTGLVWLGDWASEHLGELVAELKTTRAQLERARLAQGDVPDLSEFVQPQFLAAYKAWYAAVTAAQGGTNV